MAYLENMRQAQRASGSAAVLAIGTANPPNCFSQADFPDFYFQLTDSDHMTQLKAKFKRICEKSMIEKRYFSFSGEMLKERSNICDYMESSLDTRISLMNAEIPKLGEKAASLAIKEWGQPKSEITHLIFCTTSYLDIPGADYQLVKLLGLNPSINRFMISHYGCFAGAAALRLAKDLAENNAGARILLVCSEVMVVAFRGPSEKNMDSSVGHAIFGDGASAMIVGANPKISVERPLFHLVSASQTILPNTEGAIGAIVREFGMNIYLKEIVAKSIGDNIEKILKNAFDPIGISDWNSIFWVSHPGGPAILKGIEAKLGLNDEKLGASKHVLREYGNMSSASVGFIMDEMRKRSSQEGTSTTGEGLKWGVLFGFGPGITVETIVLHSTLINTETHVHEAIV
ncbi:hypothetical protein L6164_016898 [Bauhinia variegata]|uniref:Uncharacterized protein n=1 Tax=Bauhinia variegata TaxID=167791 RepID=A0ACB9N847_BAUVA|nr:hypothetical protein L6164_016898 [Bauhinia variegata]